MSLLPATSHANPTTPFWASSSGGTVPSLLNSLTSESIYNFTDYSNNYVVGVLAAVNNKPVSGTVMVTVNLNVFSSTYSDDIPVSIVLNGVPWYATTAYATASTPHTCYSFTIGIPYVAGDSDTYEYNFTILDSSNEIFVKTSCSYVFYPYS